MSGENRAAERLILTLLGRAVSEHETQMNFVHFFQRDCHLEDKKQVYLLEAYGKSQMHKHQMYSRNLHKKSTTNYRGVVLELPLQHTHTHTNPP